MDELAAAAGITKRTLYKIIESREKLIGDIVIGFIQDVQEKISSIISGEKNYDAAARRVMAEFPLLTGRMNSPAMAGIFALYPDVEKLVIDRRNELTAGLTAFIDRGIESGFFRKHLNAPFIMQLLQAMVLYFTKVSNGEEAFSKNISAAFSALMRGIMTAPVDKQEGGQ
jgi:AcrR family transcriptional regulator